MQPRKHLWITCSVLLIAALLVACEAPAAAPAPPTDTPVPPADTPVPPAAESIPSQSSKLGRMRSTAAMWMPRCRTLPTTANT